VLKTPGIIIKEVDYRDNDKMITLFSPEHGRIDALSRGCKKQGSKLMASSQLFNCGEYLFNTRGEKNYHAGCEITHSFFGLRETAEKLFTASFFVELAGVFIVPNQGDRRLYSLLLNSLFSLEKKLNDRTLIMQFFLIKFADIAGLRPYVGKCMDCKKQEKSYYFYFDEGGVLCYECAKNTPGRKRRLSSNDIEIMKGILDKPSKAIREEKDFFYSKNLNEVMFIYLQDKSHQKIKSYELLRQFL